MWSDHLSQKNLDCLRKYEADGRYGPYYVGSDIIQTPFGPRPTQHLIHCMRCGVLIADRRNSPFTTGRVMTTHTEDDELRHFPDMRKAQILLAGGSKMTVMLCKDCVVPVVSHEDDERLMFVVVAGHAVFFDQCGKDDDFIKKQIKDLERHEVEK